MDEVLRTDRVSYKRSVRAGMDHGIVGLRMVVAEEIGIFFVREMQGYQHHLGLSNEQ